MRRFKFFDDGLHIAIEYDAVSIDPPSDLEDILMPEGVWKSKYCNEICHYTYIINKVGKHNYTTDIKLIIMSGLL